MKGLYDVADHMRTALTVDQIRLEEEIEDLEEQIALIENLFMACNFHNLIHVNEDVLRKGSVNERLLHRRKKKLEDKLESKRKSLEYVVQRLEEY